MARRDFDNYYNQICNQYFELQQVLKDLSKEVSEGMIEPKRIEQLKQTIVPVENNYRTLGYIKYLLDKPKRKRKELRYRNMSKKLLKQSEGRTQKDLVRENNDIIKGLHI